MINYSERLREIADLLEENFHGNLIVVLEMLTNIVHSLMFHIPTKK